MHKAKNKKHVSISEIVEKSDLLKNSLSNNRNSLPYQEIVSLGDSIYDNVKKFLSKSDCYICVARILIKFMDTKLTPELNNQPDQPKKSNGFFNDTEKEAIKSAIIEYFAALPRVYFVHFNLPNVIHSQPLNIKINDNVTLQFENLRKDDSKDTKEYHLSVRIKHVGHLSHHEFEKPFSIFKQIVYLGICRNLFTINTSHTPNTYSSRFPQKIGLLHNLILEMNPLTNFFIDNKNKEKTNIELAQNESEYINQIEIDPKLNTNTLGNDIQSYAKVFNLLTTKYNKTDKNKILSGLEWAFASEIQQNETFKFILKCIAIEALIGDDDNEGSTQRLMNRCAYQLARNHEERKEILSKFPELYRLRSRLVHGNRALLEPDEKDQLYFADRLLRRIFISELQMLLNEQINQTTCVL